MSSHEPLIYNFEAISPIVLALKSGKLYTYSSKQNMGGLLFTEKHCLLEIYNNGQIWYFYWDIVTKN